MTLGVASGHYSHPRPLLIVRACNRANMKKEPSKAIINTKGMYQGQYEKGHILILLLTNFNREYSVGTFDEQKQ
jgi:hypothetical protein